MESKGGNGIKRDIIDEGYDSTTNSVENMKQNSRFAIKLRGYSIRRKNK